MGFDAEKYEQNRVFFVDHAIDNLLNRMVLSGCAMLLRLLFVLCINMKTV
ncbi:MAG: hypothetical protein AABX47_00560 [Nanoarchaeota archaeon]